MNLDNDVIYHALRSKGSYLQVVSAGISLDVLAHHGCRAWRFIQKYVADYSDVPPAGLVKELTEVEITPPAEDVSLDFLVDKIFERREFNVMKAGFPEVGRFLEAGEVKEARDRWEGVTDTLGEVRAKRSGLITLGDVVEQVRRNYLDAKRGVMGMPFPWPSLNDWTRGMLPSTLTFFVARPAVGKTWIVALIMIYCWMLGKKVLIVSPEMGADELAERVVCAHGRVSFGGVVSGVLSSVAESDLNREVDFLKSEESGSDRFIILDDDDKMTPELIEAIVESERPDIVGIDSTYMLKVTDWGKSNEKFAATVGWMRLCAKRSHIPWIGMSQLSRDATKIDAASWEKVKSGQATGGLENTAAKSDETLWHVHNLFALFRDEEVQNELSMVALKIRRRAKGGMFCRLDWNLETMCFNELYNSNPSFGVSTEAEEYLY